MDVSGSSDASSNEDVSEGREPGASASTVFISTDSYEEVNESMNTSFHEEEKKRLPSGNIDEIRLDFDQPDGLTEGLGYRPKSELSTDDSMGISSEGSITQNSCSNTPIQVEEVDYVHSEEWRNQNKHVFILSSAGKPIYSRYGDEEKLATIMGVMQALVSFVQDSKDIARCITAGQHKFVFMTKEHIVLVAAAQTNESIQQVYHQLQYIYNQMISVLTFKQLERIFVQRSNYDLRRLLTGAEKFFDNLMTMMETEPSCILGAVNCLQLDTTMRDLISATIAQNAKMKDLVFAILMCENQLICLVRLKKYTLHPMDLHLIFNLVMSNQSFKSAESWTPVCLPNFDSGGYLHAHISYLDTACNACLLLLSVDKDVFFKLSECKHKVQEKLLRQRCLQAITDSVLQGGYKSVDTGIPDLRHFLYKCRSTCQFTSPKYTAPYSTERERGRLLDLYKYLHHRVHAGGRPLKILYHVGDHETLLAWVTSGFELYTVFGPLITKNIAINAVDKLLKWIKKKEDKLFILNSPTF